ncbi:hypothetical protein QUF70_14620, partial [Desulfobacterales bacterium HSG17]|nr:hypothetical protein [Desulfobacterales bacterium HSG17]
LFKVSGQETLAFLNQMNEVREIFSDFLDKSKGKNKKNTPKAAVKNEEQKSLPDIPLFDLDVKFRVNKDHEQMANQIIEWRMDVGGQIFYYKDKVKAKKWSYGDKIKFIMRWAKNSDDYPIFGGNSSITDEIEKTVTYEFNNQWSLFTLIQLHASGIEDFNLPFDPKPNTLKFEIDTRKKGIEIDEIFKTRAYIRVAMMLPLKPGKAQTLPYFPETAPLLTIRQNENISFERTIE